jgi:hypothetical protein
MNTIFNTIDIDAKIAESKQAERDVFDMMFDAIYPGKRSIKEPYIKVNSGEEGYYDPNNYIKQFNNQ